MTGVRSLLTLGVSNPTSFQQVYSTCDKKPGKCAGPIHCCTRLFPDTCRIFS
jgi:hypothetical protein